MISTYRAKRRQKAGTGYREPDQLLPELHLARTTHSQLSAGYAYETQIEPEQFIAELVELDMDRAMMERIAEHVGLTQLMPAASKDTRREPLLTGKPPAKRVPGITKTPPPPPIRHTPRKQAAKKVTAEAPQEKLTTRDIPGSPAIPQRTLEEPAGDGDDTLDV